MGQKTPEVPEYLEFLEYLISCFLGLCSLGYLAFVSWLPVFSCSPLSPTEMSSHGHGRASGFWPAVAARRHLILGLPFQGLG